MIRIKFPVIAATIVAVLSFQCAFAQVSESPELASRIKDEGLNNSQIEQISQYMTDLLGSRLTASQQKRRAEGLVISKLREFGLSNPRAEFAYEFTRGGWDVVKTYAAMTAPYYCAFSVNPKAWTGSTHGLVKGECVVFDVQGGSREVPWQARRQDPADALHAELYHQLQPARYALY